LVTVFKSYARKRKVGVFSEHSVDSSFDYKVTSSIVIILTSSSAVAERPRDAVCPSVVRLRKITRPESFIIVT